MAASSLVGAFWAWSVSIARKSAVADRAASATRARPWRSTASTSASRRSTASIEGISRGPVCIARLRRTDEQDTIATRRCRRPRRPIACCLKRRRTGRSSDSGRTRTCPSSRRTRSWRRSVPICAADCSATRRCRFPSRSIFPPSRASSTRARSSWRRHPTSIPNRTWTASCATARASTRLTGRSVSAICSRSSIPCRGCDVLVDDQPMPYARELWLPLVWFLIR